MIISFGCSKNDYFFDKETFQKDHVTYMDYEAYQNPMRLEFEYWNQAETRNIFSFSEEEIRFVFNELKKSERIDSKVEKSKLIDGVPRYVWFFVRHLDNENSGNIVLHVDVNENKVAEVKEGEYVKITDALWNYLMEIEKREENAS